jgi:ribosomal protein S18 acetylase RimI-like enzyme
MSVTIRKLENDLIPDVARIHLQAFDGYMNTRIGRRYVYSFIEWFTQSSDAIALTALAEGAVAGYVVGAPHGYQHRMARELLFVAACGVLSHPWVFLDSRFRRQIRSRLKGLIGVGTKDWAAPALPQPTMRLVGIGVSPNMRGRQIGYRLMEAFESEARSRGMKSLILTVYKENSVARKLYERRGWSPSAMDESSMSYSLVFAKGQIAYKRE